MSLFKRILHTATRVAVDALNRRLAPEQAPSPPDIDADPLPPTLSPEGSAMVWEPEVATMPPEQPPEPLKGSLAYRLKHQ
jgi:hypothetical protein